MKTLQLLNKGSQIHKLLIFMDQNWLQSSQVLLYGKFGFLKFGISLLETDLVGAILLRFLLQLLCSVSLVAALFLHECYLPLCLFLLLHAFFDDQFSFCFLA
ncbi:hypothetical protein FGO68_gene8044 [Halteria grandinella]|uniref:Uncharacterized protein n=1 Tax=Halteria grandinella TaxID=5974 RepID=A0A8J8NY28_HALGN|nr:hypothetical protein FGO68_gene8044 [Halteria grandinella]